MGWHAAARAEVSPTETVLVFGCGVIGLGAVLASSHRGASVIAVDIDESKLDRAKKIGARHSIDSSKEDLRERVAEITDGSGPQVVIEAVGLPATYKEAVELVCFAGRIVYIGYAKAPVEYETKTFLLKELDIRGSRNALQEDFHAVIKMLGSGMIDVGNLTTQRFLFPETAEACAFWAAHQDAVTKLLIRFGS